MLKHFSFIQGVDIANIKVVVVYGLPDTLSQLYQVITITLDVSKK